MEELLLLIGGDPERRSAIRGTLSDKRFKVVVSDSPQVAQTVVKEAAFDALVILDDGRMLALRGLASTLKRLGSNAVIFFVLTRTSNSEQLLGLLPGAILIQADSTSHDVAQVIHESLRKQGPHPAEPMEDSPTQEAAVDALAGGNGQVGMAEVSTTPEVVTQPPLPPRPSWPLERPEGPSPRPESPQQPPPPAEPMEEISTLGAQGPLVLGALIERRHVYVLEHARRGDGRDLIVARLTDLVKDPAERETFLRLAGIAAKLEHKNLPATKEIDTNEGHPYQAWLAEPGAMLLEIRRHLYDADRWPSPACATLIIAEIAGALEIVHDAKLVHGGLSPSWIWVTKEGQVKLFGAGIANICRSHEQSLQMEGLAFPNPYLAPEQIEEGITDLKSDLFVLGTLLYELITGDPLFLRDDAFHTNDAILSCNIPEIDRVLPEALTTVLHACLTKDPDRRPRSAEQVRRALQQALKDPAIRSTEKKGGLFGKLFKAKRPARSVSPVVALDPRVELRELVSLKG